MNDTNSTTNTILVILLVVIVGFVVWYMVDQRKEVPEDTGNNNPVVEVQLP